MGALGSTTSVLGGAAANAGLGNAASPSAVSISAAQRSETENRIIEAIGEGFGPRRGLTTGANTLLAGGARCKPCHPLHEPSFVPRPLFTYYVKSPVRLRGDDFHVLRESLL